MTSRVAIALDGVTRLFTVPFPYIDRSHVVVSVNQILQNQPLDYTWTPEGSILLAKNATGVLTLVRKTPIDEALVTFHNGSQLTQDELNLAVLQNLYAAQEIRDYYDALIDGTLDKLIAESGTQAGPVIDRVVQEILSSEELAALQARIADIDTNAQTITDQVIRLDSVEELVDSLANVDGSSITTFLLDEQQARIDGDTAINDTISIMGAKSGDGLSFVFDLDHVKVTPTESLGSRLSGLESSVGDNTAAIATEQSTRVTEDEALATQISNLQSSVNNANALITEEASTRASEDDAMTERIDGMLATVAGHTALILSEQTARADADGALASSIDTLQSEVDGNTASISTQQSVINGIAAQYMVKLDVNGYVSGFGQWNDGASSKFYVLADKFAVITPGKAATVPFAVDAAGVYMNTAYIRNLVVDKISGGAISSQWNLNNTSGRIVLDTGAYMKVIGVGFGANSDLIEWFGPKMSISLCTKANAVTYVGMDGSAYFGGSLSAGTLYNALQTTSTANNAQVSCGPFGTNGNPKTVVLSYSFQAAIESTGANPGGFSASGTPSTTIKLYRKMGSGSEALIATLNFSGDIVVTNSTTEADIAIVSIAGSYTYTDTSTNTGDRTFRAEITARNEGTVTHPNGIGSTAYAQTLGIVSTEE